ncbi:hypothetical protein [Streptomyces sp. 2224.1]|uniref:hypothetical protein n=1 Tax=Streptomyces sp. 2224.1 TaxID=1881020 RepID=UPI00210BA53F|nr:hypothetical protein [Streptomyces sp. 2224.1]
MTIEKIPSITETTASHPIRGDRAGKSTLPEWYVVVAFVEAMIPSREEPVVE